METITVGLSFSTRMLGLAVFKSNQLMDYFVKLRKEMWSPEKRDLILTSLASCIRHYTISTIVLSIPNEYHQTSDFKVMLCAIESFATEHGIPVVSYKMKEIYQYFGSPVKRTRNSLMKRLVLFYPELARYYDKERQNKNKYYIKLFEAVAVAAFHWLESNKK